MRSTQRQQMVEDWLADEWEDIPHVTSKDVQQKFLEMRALAALNSDRIMAQCLQASKSMPIPILCKLFQRIL